MKALFIGDVVARPGRDIVSEVLPRLREKHDIDFVVACADNLAHGRGATSDTITEMMTVGVDLFTGGDHLFWHKGFEDIIDTLPIIRPANYPKRVPGVGHKLVDVGSKGNVLVINLMGRTFLNERLDDPFTKADEILAMYEKENVAFKFVDFHAEVSSEKYALGFYLDGRVDAVLGTHTHVPTCDTMILPNGTMFVTDIGMSGVIDSVLGVKKEIILDLYLTGRGQRFEWENTGRKAFRSVLLDTEERTIKRIDICE